MKNGKEGGEEKVNAGSGTNKIETQPNINIMIRRMEYSGYLLKILPTSL